MAAKEQDAKERAEALAGDEKALAELVGVMAEGSRRERQQAAATISQVAKANPEAVVPHANALVDALNRPEAQTRWEALDALTELIPYESRTCDKAVVGAETALFDEDSGPVRLAAMRFLCHLGATTENRSEKVWPLVDEGIQCYHGDLEFQDMLLAVIDFSAGKLAPQVKKELAERMSFDATNGKGALKKRASLIVENVSK